MAYRLLTTITACIVLFAVASGGYKLAGGEADVRIFASLGMTPLVVRLFGLVQAVAGLAVLWRPIGTLAAVLLLLCNTLATAGLYAAGEQPFAVISWIFVAMAGMAVQWARVRSRGGLAPSSAAGVPAR